MGGGSEGLEGAWEAGSMGRVIRSLRVCPSVRGSNQDWGQGRLDWEWKVTGQSGGEGAGRKGRAGWKGTTGVGLVHRDPGV